jgi:hypothetical protein
MDNYKAIAIEADFFFDSTKFKLKELTNHSSFWERKQVKTLCGL